MERLRHGTHTLIMGYLKRNVRDLTGTGVNRSTNTGETLENPLNISKTMNAFRVKEADGPNLKGFSKMGQHATDESPGTVKPTGRETASWGRIERPATPKEHQV